METLATTHEVTPKILFVDDEQRVLNSMRIMFRRRFELFLATDGRSALDIVKGHDIDVIVADHRMPQMTGVEVLTAVRTLSPRTVRILLTGYADLDAVEGSINDGEVFRFLTKPCAPKQLRAAIDLAVDASQNAAAALPSEIAEPIAASESVRSTPEQLAATDVIDSEVIAAAIAPEQPAEVPAVKASPGDGIVVFSVDADVIASVDQAARDRFPVYVASNIVQVVKTLTEHRPGVLITDVTDDRRTIQTMTAKLKQQLPELVTIVVSAHRDALDMIWLINHGQIFRFLRKPLSPGRCAVSMQAALQHHRTLRANPVLVERHTVEASDEPSGLTGMFDKLKSVRRLWA